MNGFDRLMPVTGRILPVGLLLASCSSFPSATADQVPAIPVSNVQDSAGIVTLTVPFEVKDELYQLTTYGPDGTRALVTYQVALFPTDVFITYDPLTRKARAFLRRSPHGGCLLDWKPQERRFEDPCYGSRFAIDGQYIFGPAQRNLDELTAYVEGDMIWIRSKVSYGQAIQ